MFKRSIFIICLSVYWVVLCVLPANAQVNSVFTIKDIRVTGNNQIDTSTILFRLESKIGQNLDINKIRRDIKSLYKTGFFDDISILYEEVEDQKLTIVIRVQERLLIREILISGAEVIQLSSLKDELVIDAGDRYDPVKVRESCNKIITKYKDRGYNYVFVTPRLAEAKHGSVALLLSVDEGTKVRIGEIKFIGTDSFWSGNRFWGLKSRMTENREHWWMSMLTSSGKFKKDLLADDLLEIEEFYKSHGYLNVSIGEPRITISPPEKKFWRKPRRKVTIVVPIIEGDIYHLGEIDVSVGDESIFPQSLVARVIRKTHLEKFQKYFGGSAFFSIGPRFDSGEVYSFALEQEAITQLNDLYGMAGYLYVMIDPQKKIDEEHKIVDMTFKIIEGEQTFLHRLEFKGNFRTRDRVLRRNFLVIEGDVFNTQKIKQSIARTQYLGYIDEVKPQIKPQSDMTQIDVEVSLNDSKQTELQLAGGYSGYDGLYGTFGISEHNLFGRGQELNFNITSGKRRDNLNVSFTDEWLFDRPYLGSIAFWKTSRDYDYSKRRTKGGSLMTGRAFKYHFASRIGYKWEKNHVYDVDIQSADEIQEQEGDEVTSSVTTMLIHETLDNRRDPTRGSKTKLTFEYAGSFFGGENQFYKSQLSCSFFKPLPKKLVLGLYGELDYANGLHGRKLPFYERYFLGGPRSVRGYEDRSIGPWDEYGNNLGGNKALRLSAEVLIPIAGPLKTVLFVDAGDTYAKEDQIDIRSLRPSVGFEVRFFVPGFGIPLRFIWGYNLDPLENESKNDFQFTMGTFL